ncbi:MAG: hypothetical protein ACREQ9_10420 [Candidatus Binatia bacterium]
MDSALRPHAENRARDGIRGLPGQDFTGELSVEAEQRLTIPRKLRHGVTVVPKV